MSTPQNPTVNHRCEQRIDAHLRDRLEDLQQLFSNPDESLAEYGLAVDYVAPGTLSDQPEGYFRYQIYWGGPSDEFRFFVNPDLSCHRVEYWFLDWFDGAHRILADGELQVVMTVWQWFEDIGCAESAFAHAMQTPP